MFVVVGVVVVVVVVVVVGGGGVVVVVVVVFRRFELCHMDEEEMKKKWIFTLTNKQTLDFSSLGNKLIAFAMTTNGADLDVAGMRNMKAEMLAKIVATNASIVE